MSSKPNIPFNIYEMEFTEDNKRILDCNNIRYVITGISLVDNKASLLLFNNDHKRLIELLEEVGTN